MKAKILSLVALMATGNANAAIDDATTGNGELFFTIWDKVAQVAYTKDLGIKMNDFLPGTANASTNQTFALAGDDYWTSFLGRADPASTVWMIGAMDSTDPATPGGSRYLSTSSAPVRDIMAQFSVTLNHFSTANSFVLSVTNTGTHGTQSDGSSITTSLDGFAYPESGGIHDMATWAGHTTGWISTANVNDKLNFYYLTTNNLPRAVVTQYGADANAVATWSVDVGANTLQYIAATPIPAATWLFGSALVGLIGFSQRRINVEKLAA